MIPSVRLQDGRTTWKCPVCLFRETVWEERLRIHQVGGLICLQRQITSLQETLDLIIQTKFGGEL